ncbi:unnamed protein product [Angiostrongylus costaricensis]|uniref:DUF1279 domain-containing protein n=1 Tax=Angiostrongylus costaricensis TaxID=334426 RepID=A0A0R3PXJ4_ANGCS|nr:unnamed protein product [Angiostrongylus costaricensis]
MTEEQKREKKEKIEEMKEEEEPKSLFGKIKYYLKRYWYIAVPAHIASSVLWLGSLYAVVKCGVDVVAFLRFIHTPALVATPFRYMTTLVFIQAAFWTLRRMGKLQTAREVEFKVGV